MPAEELLSSSAFSPYIGAVVGGAAVLGVLVVLLTVPAIVLCTRARARHKMKIQMAQKLSQRTVSIFDYIRRD
ncbi:hypothetical protein GBAR_LOCUS31451 [Geodia barretti]|uniref:Uncharacterized protein n=1 Tax=Geodia barretti TaxID=519541 RepID=A0AA35U077_GEOBA|nr:hypothetical protein GBAR_LOCUS31451 [Geodia barretti]